MQTSLVWSCLPFIRSTKTILQGTLKWGRRQGRQGKWWEDDIREWTGLEFAKSQRAVGKREVWRKLVVKSPVVPQRPSRLRDRRDEMMSAGECFKSPGGRFHTRFCLHLYPLINLYPVRKLLSPCLSAYFFLPIAN